LIIGPGTAPGPFYGRLMDTFIRHSHARIRRQGRRRSARKVCQGRSADDNSPRFTILSALLAILSASQFAPRAKVPPSKLFRSMGELTVPISRSIHRSQGTCLLPFGILRSTDRIPARHRSAGRRYAGCTLPRKNTRLSFPEYYFGQIAEARHQPGTMAYSRGMQLALLQETSDEMARNGCKKVIIVNGHGGNESLLPYFAQTQLDKPHDYVVYVFDQRTPDKAARPGNSIDMHAGESETSKMMISRPDTVHLDRGPANPAPISTARIYRRCLHRHLVVRAFPNHYSATAPRHRGAGQVSNGLWIDAVVKNNPRRESRRHEPQTSE